MEGDWDNRNNRGKKGMGKNGYSFSEQKRIEDIKIKKAMQREEQLKNEKNPKPKVEGDSEMKEDKFFGQKMTRKLKNKLKDEDELDWD